MRKLISDIIQKLSTQEQSSSANDILLKFNDAENYLYSKLPPLPAMELIPEKIVTEVLTKVDHPEETSDYDENEVELKILQRFNSSGIFLSEIKKNQSNQNVQLEFKVKLHKLNDADNLTTVIQKLRFDLGDNASIDLFRSKNNPAKNKQIRILVTFSNRNWVHKGAADVRN